MKKKVLSLAMALALCLGLTVPAFAASDLTGNQLYPAGDWGNGPSLTLKGVTAERETPNLHLSYCYDVAVGGSLVLDMPFPAGKDRHYTIMPASIYIPSNMTDYVDDYIGEDWEIPMQSEGGEFDASSGKTQYVYNFTEADRGTSDGFDKAIYMHIYWEDSAGNSVYPLDYGSVYFLIHVVPAESEQHIPASGTAYASTQTVTVDGKAVEFQMYALKDENGNGTNYIKLRDLAYVLNGTEAQFAVGYDGTISLTTGQPYAAAGGEMTTPFSGDRTYTGGTQSVKIDGQAVDLTAITLLDDNGGGYNYFKLRDLGKALGFNVGWSAEQGVSIETDEPYAE